MKCQPAPNTPESTSISILRAVYRTILDLVEFNRQETTLQKKTTILLAFILPSNHPVARKIRSHTPLAPFILDPAGVFFIWRLGESAWRLLETSLLGKSALVIGGPLVGGPEVVSPADLAEYTLLLGIRP